MKKFSILSFLALAIIISSYSHKSVVTDPNPPTTYTGAPTNSRTCVNCHNSFALNTSGGSIVATGLPSGSYAPGQVYNFSVTITNATTVQIWGFTIKAVITGTSGTALGTFNTTNPNTNISAAVLRNTNGAAVSGNSYTYTNLSWTAPLTGTSPVSFYVTGVAGDGDASEVGDYVYSNSYLNIVLPVSLGEVKGQLEDNAAVIEWTTFSESGSINFDLERSFDGKNFDVVKSLASSGGSSIIRNYKLIDNNLPKNENNLFYRLRITDQNGKIEYSKVISLKPSVFTYIESIYPTLINSNDQVKVRMVSNSVQSASVTVFSPTGSKLTEQVQQLQKGGNEFTIGSFKKSGSGIYLLRVKAGNFSATKKLLVQ